MSDILKGKTAIFLASDGSVSGVTGEYFYKCRIARSSRRSKDPELAKKLYEFSEELINGRSDIIICGKKKGIGIMILGIHPLILLMALVGFAAEITAVIIGFIIVSGKIKSVKILGIGYIVTGIIGIVTQAAFLARNIVRTSDIIRILINVDTTAAAVSSLFGLLCVCLFVHKNYGCKWIYFPLFAQPIVSAFSRVASGFVLSHIGGEGVLIAGTGLSTNVTSLVTGTVIAIILIVVFYRNRKNEKIIPHAWIIRLITYCWSLVMIIASIGFYAFCLSGGSGAESIYFEHIENFSLFQTIYTLFGSFVGIVMPVYILVMAKRAERKLEETSAYIED